MKATKDKLAKSAEARATLVLGGAILLAVVVLAYSIINRQESTDPFTGCPVNGPLASPVVVLLDLTDPLHGTKRAEIRETIERVARTVDKHERLSIFVIDQSTKRDFTPIFSRCSPGGFSASDQMAEGALSAKKKVDDFHLRLHDALDKLDLDVKKTAATSPILESIVEISQSSIFWGSSAKLFVFSDMLQHSDRLSLYDCSMTYDGALSKGLDALTSRASLQGSAVAVAVLPRLEKSLKSCAQPNAIHFWKVFFDHAGAKSLSWNVEASRSPESH